MGIAFRHFDFANKDYVIDSATGIIDEVAKAQAKKGKAKEALCQLTSIYNRAVGSPEFSKLLTEARVERLQHFASELALYIQEADPYGVVKWLIFKAQTRLGSGVASDLFKVSEQLKALCPRIRQIEQEQARLLLKRRPIEELYEKINPIAPDPESVYRLRTLLHEAAEYKSEAWYQQKAKFCCDITKPCLLSVLKLVFCEESFPYLLRKQAQDLLQLCSLQELLSLITEQHAKSSPERRLLLLGDILSKADKKEHNEKYFKDAVESFSEELWFFLSGNKEGFSEPLGGLVATVCVLQNSFDWAHDFLVRNRRCNDKVVESLIVALQKAKAEQRLPTELQPDFDKLIQRYTICDRLRIRMAAIIRNAFAKEPLKLFLEAFSVELCDREAFDEALTFLADYTIDLLNSQPENQELQQHLHAIFRTLENFSETTEWIYKVFERLRQPLAVNLVITSLKSWSKKSKHYSIVQERIKNFQQLEKALPALKVIEAHEKGPHGLSTLVQFFETYLTLAPELLFLRPKCAAALQIAMEEMLAYINRDGPIDLQELAKFFTLLASSPFKDDCILRFKKCEPESAVIDRALVVLKSLIVTSAHKSEIAKMIWHLQLLSSFHDQLECLSMWSQGAKAIQVDELAKFDEALLQFHQELRAMPTFQEALEAFAGCLVRLKPADPDYYAHVLAFAGDSDGATEFTNAANLYQNTPEKMTQLIGRIEQLNEVKSEVNFSSVDIIKSAVFLAASSPEKANEAIHCKRKSRMAGSFAIPRSLVAISQHAFMLLKSKCSRLKKSGSFKKLAAALHLPPLEEKERRQASLIAQAAVKADLHKESQLKSFLNEEAIYKELSGCPGIWPLYASGHYKIFKFGVEWSQGSLFMPIADSSLHNAKLPFIEQLQVAINLTQGLQAMHAKNILHGDLKELNALYSRKADATVTAGWIDFGEAMRVSQPYKGLFSNYYGTIYYTAPELFGEKDFSGDPFKLEILALGYVLYCLNFEKQPPWSDLLWSYYDLRRFHTITQRAKKRMHTLVKKDIEAAYATLTEEEKTRPLTPKERYRSLIYQMLRFDPALRLDLPKVLETLQNLLPSEASKI